MTDFLFKPCDCECIEHFLEKQNVTLGEHELRLNMQCLLYPLSGSVVLHESTNGSYSQASDHIIFPVSMPRFSSPSLFFLASGIL